MNNTSIEWTDYSASLLKYRDGAGKSVWHCEKLSAGCTNCYSAAMAERFKKGGPFNASQTLKVKPFFDEAEAKTILNPKKLAGKRVFIDDMTDLFGEWVEDYIIAQHFAVFFRRPDVTFQILTKRPERMAALLNDSQWHQHIHEAIKHQMGYDNPKRPAVNRSDLPLKNVWLGTSVENQQTADERIPRLLKVPAAVRFLSCEPLLSPIEFSNVSGRSDGVKQLGNKALDGISWLICGGESGPGARPCNVAWIRSIVAQCKAVEVPCFVKQLGSVVRWNGFQGGYGDGPSNCWPTKKPMRHVQGEWEVTLRDRKGGDPEEWPEDLRVRQFPKSTA